MGGWELVGGRVSGGFSAWFGGVCECCRGVYFSRALSGKIIFFFFVCLFVFFCLFCLVLFLLIIFSSLHRLGNVMDWVHTPMTMEPCILEKEKKTKNMVSVS